MPEPLKLPLQVSADTGGRLPLLFSYSSSLILSDKQKLLADKLAAILNLANTLDESRKGKIGEVKGRLEEERLVVTAKARAELLLEQWAFDDCAPFFEDVFGIEPVLIVKSGLM